MKRLTTNKSASDMRMMELAHNCCYIQNGCARYRDYDKDIDARDLARHLMVHNGFWNDYGDSSLTDKEMTDNDVFDDTMIDLLMLGEEDHEGLIAMFYRLIWVMAELREHLKEYEDTGLSPGQIIEIDRLYQEKCQELAASKHEAEAYHPLEGYTYEGQQLYLKKKS